MTWMFDKDFLERLDLTAYNAPDIATRLDLPLDVVTRFVDPARAYRVESNLDYGWVAGTNGAGQPTLVFIGRPRLSGGNQDPLNAISFDLAGRVTIASVKVDDEDGLDDEEYVLGMLEDELGFTHVGNAEVRAFKHPALWHYALVPFPFHLHDVVVGDEEGDLDIARGWIRDGSYVLHSGNAYFMSARGEVESS